jgi:toxin-antitoxin system PIN domain toxin
MILVDVNIPIHAINIDSACHERVRTWWDGALSGAEPVVLPWATIFGFVRITTHPRVMVRPLSLPEASEYVQSWLAQPCVLTLDPTDGHWTLAEKLLRAAGTAGNLTTDAHLAALAIQHGCELYTTDADFGRFPGLRWKNLAV